MVYFTNEQRVFMVLEYEKCRQPAIVINRFRHQFPDREPPCRQTVQKNYVKYRTHATSLNRHRGNSGRPRTARTDGNINEVRNILNQNPKVSCRRNPSNITKSSFNRIISKDIKWHPYRLQIRHELLPDDNPRRLRYCNWLLGRPEAMMRHIICGDEAGFSLNGRVSTWNVRCYAENPPRDFTYDRPNNRQKLSVWAALIGDGTMIGPYFFGGNVNGAAYLAMLNDFAIPELVAHYGIQRNEAFRFLWWIQVGAPAHRLIEVRETLQHHFPQRVIAFGHDQEWPPRSPDLTCCDFFLWGYVKSKVYLTPPASLAELRERIIAAMEEIPREMIARSVFAMRTRARKCVANGGGHIEGRSAPPH